MCCRPIQELTEIIHTLKLDIRSVKRLVDNTGENLDGLVYGDDFLDTT